MDTAPISDGIRAAIRDCGLAPHAVAVAAGVSPQQLYRFLSGQRGLSLESLDKIATFLKLRITRE